MRRHLATLLAALVLALASVLLVQTPAQAQGPTMTICIWRIDEDGRLVCDPYTVEVPVAGPRKWWPKDCWVCLPSFRFEEYWIDPAYRAEFHDGLGEGLALLAQASLTKDEKLAEQLRTEAAQVFYSAAKLIEQGGEVTFKEFDWFEPETGKVYGDPQPAPSLEFGASLEAGIGYMQSAADDPDPHPWIEAAMKEFERANSASAALAAG